MNRSGYLDIVYDDTYTVADISNTANGYVRGVLPPAAAGSVATTGVDFFKTATWNRRTSFAKIHTTAVDTRVDIDPSTGAAATPTAGDYATVRITQYSNDSLDPVVTDYSYLVKTSDTWTIVADALKVLLTAAGYSTAGAASPAIRITGLTGAPFAATAIGLNGKAFTLTTVGKFAQGTVAEIEKHYLNDPLGNWSLVAGHLYDIISLDVADATDSNYDGATEGKKVRFIVDATAANGQALSAEILAYFTGINSL